MIGRACMSARDSQRNDLQAWRRHLHLYGQPNHLFLVTAPHIWFEQSILKSKTEHEKPTLPIQHSWYHSLLGGSDTIASAPDLYYTTHRDHAAITSTQTRCLAYANAISMHARELALFELNSP